MKTPKSAAKPVTVAATITGALVRLVYLQYLAHRQCNCRV